MQEFVSNILRDGLIPQNVLSNIAKGQLQQYLTKDPSVSYEDISVFWQKLVETANDVSVVDKYLNAACNSICVFLNSASHSNSLLIKVFVGQDHVWEQSFSIARRALSEGKQKPAVQIIETLTGLLAKKPASTRADSVLRRFAADLIQTVLAGNTTAALKEACLILNCFGRRVLDLKFVTYVVEDSFGTLSDASRRRLDFSVPDNSAQRNETSNGSSLSPLLAALVLLMNDFEIRSAAARLFSIVCDLGEDAEQKLKLEQLAFGVVHDFISTNEEILQDFASNALPLILKDRPRFERFLARTGAYARGNEAKVPLLLAIISTGRRKLFIQEADLPEILNLALLGNISETASKRGHQLKFETLLAARSSEIRVGTLDLMTASSQTHAVVHADTLDSYVAGLRYLFEDTDPFDRGRIFSSNRQYLSRVINNTLLLQRRLNLSQTMENATVSLSQCVEFIQSLALFLMRNLGPHITYQRHILALNTMSLLLDTCQGNFSEIFTDSKYLSSLVLSLTNLVLDPYDDVRSISAQILRSIARHDDHLVHQVMSLDYQQKAENLSQSTNRGDHADALGRIYGIRSQFSGNSNPSSGLETPNSSSPSLLDELLVSLESHCQDSKMLQPSLQFPVHGRILGVVYIITDLTKSSPCQAIPQIERLIGVCAAIWEQVKLRLCVDSPEFESEEEGYTSDGPKDLLAYSWRVLRDSSLLMQSLLNTNLLKYDALRSVGYLCLEQMKELRHRGAFSTVANTYVLCCEKVRSSPDQACQTLINDWFLIAFAQIREQSTRLTRRSAGLPTMIAALVDARNFRNVSEIVELLIRETVVPENLYRRSNEALQEQQLPQVHALNSLKEFMTQSRFRSHMEPFVPRLLELSAQRMTSNIWAIRNCGLMLFRSCLNRVTATGDQLETPESLSMRSSNPSAKPLAIAASLLGYRKLGEATNEALMLNGGKVMDSQVASDTIFAALDLIDQVDARPAQTDTILNDLIVQQLKCPEWSIRDRAARLLAKRLEKCNLEAACDYVITKDIRTLRECEVHGRLLSLRHLLERMEADFEQKTDRSCVLYSQALGKTNIVDLIGFVKSPFCKAAVLDIINNALRNSATLQVGGVYGSALIKDISAKINLVNLTILDEFHLCRSMLLATTRLDILTAGNIKRSVKNSTEAILADVGVSQYIVHDLLKPCHKSALPNTLQTLVGLLVSSDQHTMFAELLEAICRLLESGEIVGSQELATEVLQHLDLDMICGRKLWNAKLLLLSYLLPIPDNDYNGINRSKSAEDWIAFIEEAAADELDFPTRFNAAKSLLIHTRRLQNHQVTKSVNQHHLLRTCLVLYDLLNDDDEDVREVAAEATDSVLPISGPTSISTINLKPCILMAKEELLDFMLTLFADDPLFVYMGHAKICGGATPSHSWRVNRVDARAVVDELRQALSSLTDLFAEERQNLYRDDIRELTAWGKVLSKCNGSNLAVSTIQKMCAWATDGLSALSTALTSSLPPGCSPLGMTYSFELAIIFVRVIQVSGALISWLQTMPGSESFRPEEVANDIKRQVDRLRDLCVINGASLVVMMSFQEGSFEDK